MARHGVAINIDGMRRHWLVRTVTAVLAVWFAVKVAEPVTLHACPVHDGITASANPSGAHGDTHATMQEHGAPAHSENPGASHQCQCLSDCAASIAAATVPARVSIDFAAIARAPRMAPATAVTLPAARARFTLPFANGPPASLFA